MLRLVILPAALTGLFCACFAVAVDWLTTMLDNRQLMLVSFTSGFLGSLFASVVLGRGKARPASSRKAVGDETSASSREAVGDQTSASSSEAVGDQT